MLKVIAYFALAVAATAQFPHRKCTSEQTNQLQIDLREAINAERLANGTSATDKLPLKLWSQLSEVAHFQLLSLSDNTTCPAGYPYYYDRGPAHCCSDGTDADRHKCVNEPFGVFIGGIVNETTALVAATSSLSAPLTFENMADTLRMLLTTDNAFSFLLQHPRQLKGLGVVTLGQNLALVVSETENPSSPYIPCFEGTPTVPTTVAPTSTISTTNAAGSTTSTTSTTTTNGSSRRVAIGFATAVAASALIA